MKRILMLAICVFALDFSASAQFKFGAHGSFYFNGSTLGVGARAHNTFTEDFEGQATFTYFLESGTFWALDADVLYNGFDIGDLESFKITPFAGLNYFNSPSFTVLGITSGGSTVGLNIGVSATKSISDSLELFIEPKFIIRSGSTLAVTAGVYF